MTIDEIEVALPDDGIDWDGRLHSYRPKSDWKSRISPDLVLHETIDDDLDPVTFEVLRNRLWTINIGHGNTLTRMSGSPIFQALDFNMSVLTEDGEIVMSAPYMQYLNTGSPLLIKFLMENDSNDPGIAEGDAFLSNDPWIGASHQMDVCIAMPVFVDGKLFSWVSNAAQQYDLGGIVPGGWPQNAPDVFSDPVVFAPFKIVEQGVLRADLDRMYLRHSRTPDMVALDLRAQLAGCRFAAKKLQEACAEFGADTVKSAMRGILDNAQRAFERKLELVPDAVLSDVMYFDEKMPGDRTTHRVQFNITKKGSRLEIDNLGTEAQSEGPNGFTYMNFAGVVLGVSGLTLLHEHTFSIGGAERQIDFRPQPGLLSCVDYPAAVSGGVLNILTAFERLQNMFGRLMVCDPELKADIAVCGPDYPLLVLAGMDEAGNYFGTALTEGAGVGSGARSHSDGVNTAGITLDPLIRMPNVEETEQYYPLLVMYRREAQDSGGPGLWRGGVGMEVALTPYKAAGMEAVTNASGQAVSTNQAMGLFGGYPSPNAQYQVFVGSDVAAHWEDGHMPRDLDELECEEHLRLRAKSNGTTLTAGDVLLLVTSGGGGYGDPLERAAADVADDVTVGYVSTEVAHDVYGVVMNNGHADETATEQQRQRARQQRATAPRVTEHFSVRAQDIASPATGQPTRVVHEYVDERDVDGHRVLACNRCDAVLSDFRDNYKLGLLICEEPASVLPKVGDPKFFLDEDMMFRRYYCPGCHVQMSTEIARATEPVLAEVMFT